MIEFESLAEFVSKLDTYRPEEGKPFAPKPQSEFYKLVNNQPVTFRDLFFEHLTMIDDKIALFESHIGPLDANKIAQLSRIILRRLLHSIDNHLMPVVGSFTLPEIRRDPTKTGMGEPVTLSQERIDKIMLLLTKVLRAHFFPQNRDAYHKRKTMGKTILNLETLKDFTSKLKSIRPAPGQSLAPKPGTKYHRVDDNNIPVTFLTLFYEHIEEIKKEIASMLQFFDEVEDAKQEELIRGVMTPLLVEIDDHL